MTPTTAAKRVGLNLLFLVPGETGGSETYARRLIPLLAELRPEWKFVAFVNEEAAGKFAASSVLGDGVELVPVGGSGRSRARRVANEQVRLPRAVKAHRIDLLHSMGSTAPFRSTATGVVTVLDVIYALEPEAHTFAMRAGMRLLVPLGTHNAERVITLSEAAADGIVQELKF